VKYRTVSYILWFYYMFALSGIIMLYYTSNIKLAIILQSLCNFHGYYYSINFTITCHALYLMALHWQSWILITFKSSKSIFTKSSVIKWHYTNRISIKWISLLNWYNTLLYAIILQFTLASIFNNMQEIQRQHLIED
jgi:hypothetical protein